MKTEHKTEAQEFSEIQIVHQKLNLLLDFFDIDRSAFEPNDVGYVVTNQYGSILIEATRYLCERYKRRYSGHLQSYRLQLMTREEYDKQLIWEKHIIKRKPKR